MSLVYTPSGKAREYSPFALNLYTGCEHQCTYCYVRNIAFGKIYKPIATPRKDVLKSLNRELLNHGAPKEQILLSFTGDPFCHAEQKEHITKQALQILKEHNAKVAILTKGGSRALDCMDEIKAFGKNIKTGATLTFCSNEKSLQYEPGAALPSERIDMLRTFHSQGIKTWVSIEPVIDPEESLECIRRSLEVTDHYKVGKLNHVKNNTDWGKFLFDSVSILRKTKKRFYVKQDLQLFESISGIKLSKEERDMNHLCLK